MYDYIIFIGRFQPLHKGHTYVIDRAFEIAKNVIIGIGSANLSTSIKNPLTYTERKYIFNDHYCDKENLLTVPLFDYSCDQMWCDETTKLLTKIILAHANKEVPNSTIHGLVDLKIGIVGFEKDLSSKYIKELSNKTGWKFESIRPIIKIDATFIRNNWYSNNEIQCTAVEASHNVLNDLQKQTSRYEDLVADHDIILKYKDLWKHAPYTPIFTATDVITHHSYTDEIVLVRRKGPYGKNKWALPGGYLEANLTIQQNALKELEEETGLVLDRVDSIPAKYKVYDCPNRSMNGRIISHAVLFEIYDMMNYDLQYGDDAIECKWFSRQKYAELELHQIFEDHHIIIQDMLGWQLNVITKMKV